MAATDRERPPAFGDEEYSVSPAPKNTLNGGRKSVPFAASFLAGGLSGTIGAVVTNPLEVVKTRMQSSAFAGQAALRVGSHGPLSSAALHVAGTLRVLGAVARDEGVRALWRGTGATLLGVIPSRAIYFSTYSAAKAAVAARLNGGNDAAWWVHLPAGLAAGVVVSTATNPLWLVKTKMQLQGTRPDGRPARYASSLACARHVFATEGVRGFYRGMTASYLGALEGMAQWVLYEQLKAAAARLRGGAADAPPDAALRPGDFFAAAALAKTMSAIAAYPHEVLRTRLREEATALRPTGGLVSVLRAILAAEGPAGLYGGMTAHLLRTVPNAAIMFFSYECLIRLYRSAFDL